MTSIEIDFALSAAELATLPVSAFGALPIETRLLAQGAVNKSVFVLASGAAPDRSSTASSSISGTWFDAEEVEALAWGVRADRTVGSDLISFALRKLHEPSFRVTLQEALAGAHETTLNGELESPLNEPTLGELLAGLELKLVGIELGPVIRRDAVPTRRAA